MCFQDIPEPPPETNDKILTKQWTVYGHLSLNKCLTLFFLVQYVMRLELIWNCLMKTHVFVATKTNYIQKCSPKWHESWQSTQWIVRFVYCGETNYLSLGYYTLYKCPFAQTWWDRVKWSLCYISTRSQRTCPNFPKTPIWNSYSKRMQTG